MVEDGQEPPDGVEGPRRKTFSPPDPDTVFTGSFPVIDSESENTPDFSPAAPTPPVAAQPRAATDAPVRKSLSDLEIVIRFDGGEARSTGDRIVELERQVALRQEEEESFEMWANIVRATRGSEAEQIIRRERIIFDGGDPEPELEDESDDDAVETEQTLIPPVSASDVEDLVEEPEYEADPVEISLEPVLEEPAAEEATLEEAIPDEPVVLPAGDEDLAALVATQKDVVEEQGVDGPVDQWPLKQKTEPAEVLLEDASDSERVVSKTDITAGLFWMYLASLVPVLGIMAGAFLVFRGLGVFESLAAVGFAGLIAGLVVAAGASLARRAKQSTLVSARHTFGVVGNAIPSGILLVVRVALLAVIVLLAVSLVTRVVERAGLWPYELWIAQVGTAVLVATGVMVLGIWGGRVLRVALWVSAALGFVGVVLLVVVQAPSLSVVTPSWSADPLVVVGAASLVLSGFLVLFGVTGGDLRDLRVGNGRSQPAVVAALGTSLPFAAVMMMAVWVSVSTPGLSVSLLTDPVGVLTEGAPSWYLTPVFLLLVLPLIVFGSWVLFSNGRGVEAVGIPFPRAINTAAVGVLSLAGVAAVLVFGVDVAKYVPAVLLSAGVIFAAWAGAFAIDSVMSRGSLADAVPTWRVAPLAGMVVASGVGLGLVSSTVNGFGWQGYLLPLLESAGLIDISPAAPGVLVALVLSALVTLIASLGARAKVSSGSHE